MQDYRIDFESLPWEPAMDGVRQKVVAHSGKKVVPTMHKVSPR
jgi:hypothetical protein